MERQKRTTLTQVYGRFCFIWLTMDRTSGGTARPLASSNGGLDAAISFAAARCARRFWNGIGSFPSDLSCSTGPATNIKAITMHTIVTNKLSVVISCGEKRALRTANAINPTAIRMQARLRSFSSLLVDFISPAAISIDGLL